METKVFEDESLALLAKALNTLGAGFASMPPSLPPEPRGAGSLLDILTETASRLQENYPYFHPLYAGQMLKPPHPIARVAYALAMWLNPNNHALDGGRASSQMEIEAVDAIALMFGWDSHLGHLTSGGTVANLEALWIAGQITQGRTILASEQAHYTHRRVSGVLQLPFETIPVDQRGRMSLEMLEKRLIRGNVGTVVVTVGTTALGALDPLPEILALREQYGFRIHVDAAYGGYFTLASNLSAHAKAAYAALSKADSLVIDPHKHGLQPYGCGCVLFHDPSVARFYQHDSPYTYFTSAQLHLGEISLECSRAGASAVALWATQRLLPLIRNGEFAAMLDFCRAAATDLHHRLTQSADFVAPVEPELDIVVWALRGATIDESSARARAVFDAAARRDLHLALVQLPVAFFPAGTWNSANGPTHVTCLRSVLMKPEHREWLDEIWRRLNSATREVSETPPRRFSS